MDPEKLEIIFGGDALKFWKPDEWVNGTMIPGHFAEAMGEKEKILALLDQQIAEMGGHPDQKGGAHSGRTGYLVPGITGVLTAFLATKKRKRHEK